MTKRIYVAATNQHVGKTTCTLGLSMALKEHNIDVGYCKPVGQKFVDLGDLKVDKDVLLFAKTIGFDIEEKTHSPVILGRGATSAFLDNPAGFPYEADIRTAAKILESRHSTVIYEGTGHPGVGGVVGLSNGKVADLLDASVILVATGGIGSTIDQLYLCACVFQRLNVPIIGVIINKVLPEKIDKVRHYVGKWLAKENIPLLGILPYDKSLSNPIMYTIEKAVQGTTVSNWQGLVNQVDDIVPGSLIAQHDFKDKKNLLLVVSKMRMQQALTDIIESCKRANQKALPISGIILTGDGLDHTDSDGFKEFEEYFADSKVPFIVTPLDTYGAVFKINKIEVKINTHTPWKVHKAIQLVKEHVDLSSLL